MSRPARPWFRFYVEAVYDRKLRRLAPEQRWLFVACLAIARQSQEPGRLLVGDAAVEVGDLVDVACMDAEAVTRGVVCLMEAGVLAEDERGWYIPRWADRQYESDTSASRTAKYRTKGCDVTTPSQPPSQDRHSDAGCDDIVTDQIQIQKTETDTEREGALSQTKADPPSKRRKAGTPIPSPFFVSEANIAWAQTKCPGLDWDRETQKLVAWAKAGDKRYVDWDAAWKNWMLKAAERKPW